MRTGRKSHLDGLLTMGLAAGKTVAQVAVEVGVSERTIQRRMERPEFRQNVTDLRGRMVDRVSGRLADAAAAAMERLYLLLEADSEAVRLGAARTILDQMLRVRDLVEFESRLRRMEGRCAEKLGS